MDEIKRAFSTLFVRDLRTVEPDKKQGVLIGDDLRIHKDDKGHYVVRFLKGTTEKIKRQYLDKLEQSNIEYVSGKDFTR